MTLRIHRSAGAHRVAFALSGELRDGDLAELDAMLGREKQGHVVLDLAEVTLVSRDGIDCIRRAVAAGADVINCPGYVRRWIVEGRGPA